MSRLHIESRLLITSVSAGPKRTHSFNSTIYSDYGKRYSDYYVDDDDDDDDDGDEDDDDKDDDDDDDDEATDSGEDDFFDWEELVKKEHNAISWVLTKEAYCFDVKRFSEKLVDATLFEAKKALTRKHNGPPIVDTEPSVGNEVINAELPEYTGSRVVQSQQYPCNSDQWPSSFSFCFSTDTGVVWPKISQFNIKLGLEKLENYVSTWERSLDWMFCVEFLGFECEDSSNVFVYEVEWSKPTCEYPIPQATASVYFALEVFKMVPYNFDRSIEVTYIFEGSHVIHYPGKIDFQEKWLEDILEAKLKLFKTFTFADSKWFQWSNGGNFWEFCSSKKCTADMLP